MILPILALKAVKGGAIWLSMAEVKRIQGEKHADSFLKVESQAKGLKAQGIKNRYEQGYEQPLNLIERAYPNQEA